MESDLTSLKGIWRSFLENHPWLLHWLQRRIAKHQSKKRLKKGFDTMDPRSADPEAISQPSNQEPDDTPDADENLVRNPTIDSLAIEAENDSSTAIPPDQTSLSRRLALSIQKVSKDLKLPKPKRYAYEEWVEFTRLIRLTTPERLNRHLGTTALAPIRSENEEGLVNWDWIGNDSPMMSGLTESEWLLERLCESLVRLEKRKEILFGYGDGGGVRARAMSFGVIDEKIEGRGAGPKNESAP